MKPDSVAIYTDKEGNTVVVYKLPRGAEMLPDSVRIFGDFPDPDPFTFMFGFLKYPKKKEGV
jgi:hypothetical protein